jgi:hypothetical protein
MPSKPIVEISSGLKARASAARYPNTSVSKSRDDIRTSITALRVKPISAVQIAASIGDPLKKSTAVNTTILSGEVAVLLVCPG